MIAATVLYGLSLAAIWLLTVVTGGDKEGVANASMNAATPTAIVTILVGLSWWLRAKGRTWAPVFLVLLPMLGLLWLIA